VGRYAGGLHGAQRREQVLTGQVDPEQHSLAALVEVSGTARARVVAGRLGEREHDPPDPQRHLKPAGRREPVLARRAIEGLRRRHGHVRPIVVTEPKLDEPDLLDLPGARLQPRRAMAPHTRDPRFDVLELPARDRHAVDGPRWVSGRRDWLPATTPRRRAHPPARRFVDRPPAEPTRLPAACQRQLTRSPSPPRSAAHAGPRA
jgi:hypothetical protein